VKDVIMYHDKETNHTRSSAVPLWGMFPVRKLPPVPDVLLAEFIKKEKGKHLI
jgi:hypothetical protein